MVAPTLPIFSFRVNWREPLTERLSFLTDVLSARKGAEQRRKLRNTPRRSIEADFLLSGRERTFWDLFQNNLIESDIYAPFYWDVAKTVAPLTAGVTDRINFNTLYREFLPGYAMLCGDHALDYEVIEIAAVDGTGIDLADPVERTWPRGTKLLPLRKAQIEDSGDVQQVSAGVGTVSSLIRFIDPNPWTPDIDGAPIYQSRPVFLREPNWVQPLTVNFDAAIASLDNQTGVPVRRDTRGRVMLGQQHRWFLPGRGALASFRDFIYRNHGRLGSFWLPTFKADLVLASDVESTDTEITIQNVGFGYSGGPFDGRAHIALKYGGGTILREITGVSPGLTSDTEIVELEAPVGLDLSAGQVRRISFADVARFDQDDFEIVHHGGPDGLHEANAVFRTFKDSRTAGYPIHTPIVTEVERSVPCGDEEVCMITFVVTLPEMPPLADETGYGEIQFILAVDPSEETGGDAWKQIDINPTISASQTPYTWKGVNYPTGIDEVHSVSFFDYLGEGPADAPMFDFKYDTAANTLTVRVYTTVIPPEGNESGLGECRVHLFTGTGLSEDAVASVTQTLDDGDPYDLPVSNDGFVDDDGTVASRYMLFVDLGQTPCAPFENPCATEIYNGPLVIQIPITIPTITHGTFESYLQVYLSLSVETPSGAKLGVGWPLGGPTIDLVNASVDPVPTPNSPVVRSIHDPACGRDANVTLETVIGGGFVTITISIDDPHFKFTSNWEVPDTVGDPNWWDHPYEYGDWVGLNIIGDAPFADGTFTSSATITLDGVSGSPAISDDKWYVAQASGPVQNGYRYRFTPSLE